MRREKHADTGAPGKNKHDTNAMRKNQYDTGTASV